MLPGCCFAFYAGWLVDAFAAAANIALLAAMAAACCLSTIIGHEGCSGFLFKVFVRVVGAAMG